MAYTESKTNDERMIDLVRREAARDKPAPADLLSAGNALAELAREIAAAAIAASGDVMDGAHAEALALEWDEALSQHEADKAGTALRDELVSIAYRLRDGFAAALCQFADTDELPIKLTDEHTQSLAELDRRIASANGACNRLAQLDLEIEGQGTLL